MVPQKVFHMAFWGTKKKCENKNLSSCLFQYSFLKYMKQEGLLFHDGCRYNIETSPLTIQTIQFITVSVMKELKKELIDSINSFMIFF